MRHPRARDLVLRIAAWADLVTENFTPGTMESWGLGYEELRKVNRGIIPVQHLDAGQGWPYGTPARFWSGDVLYGGDN